MIGPRCQQFGSLMRLNLQGHRQWIHKQKSRFVVPLRTAPLDQCPPLHNLPTFLSSLSGIGILLIFVNHICLMVKSLLSLNMLDFLLKPSYNAASAPRNLR